MLSEDKYFVLDLMMEQVDLQGQEEHRGSEIFASGIVKQLLNSSELRQSE